MLKILKKIDQAVVILSNAFLIFTIIAMVGFAFWQVVARFLLKIPTAYAEEFARLAIVWCILIGGAMAVRKSEHIRVDSLTRILPKFVQIILELISQVLIVIFAISDSLRNIGHFIHEHPVKLREKLQRLPMTDERLNKILAIAADPVKTVEFIHNTL